MNEQSKKTAEQTQKPAENRTATQKIADLEQAAMSLFNVNDNFSRDLMNLKEAIKLLDKKVNAVVQATTAGEALSDEVLTRIMIQNEVEELTRKLERMVTLGALSPETTVSENSFVVGCELDDEGKIHNPRMQFALKALPKEIQDKIVGAQAGDTLRLAEKKLRFRVLESYKIETPPAPTEATETETAPSPETATEAPTEQAAETATTEVANF
jgi:hypothetical protein